MKVTKIVQKHFLCTFWGFLVTIICKVKIDINMCEPHYVNLFFFVNLLHSPCFWLLTSFWQLDIFFDIWATGHMGKGISWLILKKEMGYLGGWGTWVMGHMGNWAHDHNFLNTAWIFTKILLDIDIDVFYLNIQLYSHEVQKLTDFKFWLVPTSFHY